MKLRKVTALFLSVAVVGGALAACGGGTESTPTPAGTPNPAGPGPQLRADGSHVVL